VAVQAIHERPSKGVHDEKQPTQLLLLLLS
jgi:hypothetical protein